MLQAFINQSLHIRLKLVAEIVQVFFVQSVVHVYATIAPRDFKVGHIVCPKPLKYTVAFQFAQEVLCLDVMLPF